MNSHMQTVNQTLTNIRIAAQSDAALHEFKSTPSTSFKLSTNSKPGACGESEPDSEEPGELPTMHVNVNVNANNLLAISILDFDNSG